VSTDDRRLDDLVRGAIYDALAESGRSPARADVARVTGLRPDDVAAAYQRLSDRHVIVLDPESGEVWMAMPFSAVPTAFRVSSGATQWWANCAWDALGIAAATQRDVTVDTTCPDCGDPLRLDVRRGAVPAGPGIVHFAVPAAHWWDDIGFT
jgi:Alkylmercury lyase